jgi:hypothetical protein
VERFLVVTNELLYVLILLMHCSALDSGGSYCVQFMLFGVTNLFKSYFMVVYSLFEKIFAVLT